MKLASPFKYRSHLSHKGFALIATISVMVLLVMVALAMLSLSTIETRSSRQAQHQDEARANARMALMMALGELQKSLGPDQRISADSSILDTNPDTPGIDGVAQPQLVGIWRSWSPELARAPLASAPDYGKEKQDRFERWLISHPEPVLLESRDYALNNPSAPPLGTIPLYTLAKQGYDIEAPLVSAGIEGAYAWHVRQENTRAKLTVQAYPKNAILATNTQLAAPDKTGYMLNSNFEDVGDQLPVLAAKVTDDGQLSLAKNLHSANFDPRDVQPHFTVHAMGLQTDVVKGGLKKDLSLAFELSDTSFASAFNGLLTPHSSYGGQVPLYEPIVTAKKHIAVENYFGSIVTYLFRISAVPTFDTLRSHHRIYRHLYMADGQATAYQRQASSKSWETRTGTSAGIKSETSLMPVMDRVFYYFTVDLSSGGVPRLILTPVVVLWNPFNVALECEGFDIYPWLDFPFVMDWDVEKADSSHYSKRNWLTTFLADDSTGLGGGIENPYFHLALTKDGTGVNPSQNIHFSPGELKIFTCADATPVVFDRLAGDTTPAHRVLMRPAKNGGFIGAGGIALMMNDSLHPNNNFTYAIKPSDRRLTLNMSYIQTSAHPYHVAMEDLSRLQGNTPNKIAEVQIMDASVLVGGQDSVNLSVANPISLKNTPETMSVQETYHRTALTGAGKQASDLFYAVNPRQQDLTVLLFGAGFQGTSLRNAPHYISQQFETREIPGTVLPTLDGVTGHYGLTNATNSGERYLPAFEIPQQAPMSIAALAHADLANTTYSPSHQIGNSMATPFLKRNTVSRKQAVGPGRTGDLQISPSPGFPIYDHSYLLNEALWDGYFYSSAAPITSPGSGPGGQGTYSSTVANITKSLNEVIQDFVKSPSENPLRNRRYHLYTGGDSTSNVTDRLIADDGFLSMAAHLMVDGAFNINSTSVEAWTALLASTRGMEFKAGTLPAGEADISSGNNTPLPRMQHPVGTKNDLWQGFRTLSDADIRTIAEEIVKEVKIRGPFLSLSEFVNRRIEDSDAGLTGTIQTAINRTAINKDTAYDKVDTANYPYKDSYVEDSTGVGSPGYLTQADVLNQLGNFITPRSDTFVIRAYGDARDSNGTILARAYCEAVVQRVPDLVDSTQKPSTQPASWNVTNQNFGRKFKIVSFRYLTRSEVN